MRPITPLLLAAVVLLAACGGPSASSLHDEVAGKTPDEVMAKLGRPLMNENLATPEGEPQRERLIYKKGQALKVDDDGSGIAIEFEGGKETRCYKLDEDALRKLTSDPGGE